MRENRVCTRCAGRLSQPGQAADRALRLHRKKPIERRAVCGSQRVGPASERQAGGPRQHRSAQLFDHAHRRQRHLTRPQLLDQAAGEYQRLRRLHGERRQPVREALIVRLRELPEAGPIQEFLQVLATRFIAGGIEGPRRWRHL